MITEKQARQQYNNAARLGWTALVQKAGDDFKIDPALILAIGSRETNLDIKYLLVPGDNGNGWGITQVDKRYYPAFVKSGDWRDAGKCLTFTARKLADEYNAVIAAQGKTVTGRFRSGQRYSYKMPALIVADAWRIVIAGYNCGWTAAGYHHAKTKNPDAGTTGKDYSADVLRRADWFRQWMNDAQKTDKTASETQPAESKSAA